MAQTPTCKWPHMPPHCGCPVGGHLGDRPTSTHPLVGGSRDGGRGSVPMTATGNPALPFRL